MSSHRKQLPPHPTWDSPAFRQLQRDWDAKLKAAGFKDIEPLNDNGSRNTPFLKDHSIRFAKRYKPVQADYYRLAGQFAEDTTSPIACGLTPQQRAIWRLHADGMDMPTIVKHLRANPTQEHYPSAASTPGYWTLKKMLSRLRQQFKRWCVEETIRDQLDTQHAPHGGLDAWLAAVPAVDTDGEDDDT